jgi:cytochrome c peroxidase
MDRAAASAQNYTPASQLLAADLSGPTSPIDPVLERLDPVLAKPIDLSPDQFEQLVAFVRS